MNYIEEVQLDLERCYTVDQWARTQHGEWSDTNGHPSVLIEFSRGALASGLTDWSTHILRDYCRQRKFTFKYCTQPILHEYRVRDHRDLMPSILDEEDLDIKATLWVQMTEGISFGGGKLTVHGFGRETYRMNGVIGRGIVVPAFFPYEIEPITSGRMLLMRSVACGKEWS